MDFHERRPIDLVAIECEARRLRARALANGVERLKRRVSAPFHARRDRHV